MTRSIIDLKFGRQAFGTDPLNYHTVRPVYPDWVYQLLQEKCGIRQGSAAFEIGAGTGLATQKLLELGIDPLIAIEPDVRLADFLRNKLVANGLTVLPSTFEDVILENNSFDLGFCATAFHWLKEDESLLKVAKLLKPGGWWVAVWNEFGDSTRADPFHEATKSLLDGPSSPGMGTGDVPFAQDTQSRIAALERTQEFDSAGYKSTLWELTLTTAQTIALYATYSNINIRPDREAVLNELARIADDQFNGKIFRNMTTILYFARRKP